MVENSFILFKPDACDNLKIIDEVKSFLLKKGILVVHKKNVVITENDIEKLWEFTEQDIISKKLLQKYIIGKELPVWFVRGEDAINQVNNLKRRVRKEYGINFLMNCIHAPRTTYEYEKDIQIFNKNKQISSKNKRLIYDTKKFKKFEYAVTQDIDNIIVEIFNAITRKNIDEYIVYDRVHKFKLYLLNDDIHELIFIVAALYNNLPISSLSDAYLMAIVAEQKNRCLIMTSDNKGDIYKIYIKLKKEGVAVLIEE